MLISLFKLSSIFLRLSRLPFQARRQKTLAIVLWELWEFCSKLSFIKHIVTDCIACKTTNPNQFSATESFSNCIYCVKQRKGEIKSVIVELENLFVWW